MKHILVLIISIVILQGCTIFGENDELACPGGQSGINCTPALEIYNLTNNDEDAREAVAKNKARYLAQKNGGKSLEPIVKTLSVSPPRLGPQMIAEAAPLPILMPASTLRVWVAPWTDSKQDLHWQTFIFTQITPRRWTIGEREIQNTAILSPVPIKNKPKK